ncbi:MAG: carbon-nitrogen hydrolase family protein [Rhodoferax sp.]|uniref:carbon-nitrogen hydrolase family protein n=1 Tax=Rhodoferax sp. TaxID=50421 RepID=UPI002ACE7B4A|nr:carbon-nitrogen hydrolase family protein [Rhodoferax sp.]MDZ7890514.1 carbon-nitrogen hydrolase family protein [Rhodoferax sp.]
MNSVRSPLKLTLWQCASAPLDVSGNLDRLEAAARDAARTGAHLLVCPEMFITGYAIGAQSVQSLAQAADGAWADTVAAIAQRHQLAVVYSYPERGADGRVYNAAQWIDVSGSRCLNYRKAYLFGELDRSQFAAEAQSARIFDFHGWQVGMLICYDVEFPEATRALALAGADLIVVPTANMADYDFVARSLVPVRAYENQVFVAYANFTGTEGGLRYGGLSVVAGPDGATLAQAGREETLVIATLDEERLTAARLAAQHVRDLTALRNPAT